MVNIPETDTRLRTNQAARILGVSDSKVREWAASGKLQQVERTPYGRLFNAEEVEALRKERETKRQAP